MSGELPQIVRLPVVSPKLPASPMVIPTRKLLLLLAIVLYNKFMHGLEETISSPIVNGIY